MTENNGHTTNSENRDKDAPNRQALKFKKRRLDRTMIGLAILAIILLTVIQTKVVQLGAGVSTSHSVLVFFAINVNILLLFLLLVLVLRNLYKIFFEQRQIFGAQLRTKLVVAFVSLSLVPTGLLFYAGLQFITTGHDYWWNEEVEKALVESVELGRLSLDHSRRFTYDFGHRMRDRIVERQLYLPERRDALEAMLRQARKEYGITLVDLYSPALELVFTDRISGFDQKSYPADPAGSLFQEAAAGNKAKAVINRSGSGDLIRVIWPVVPEQGEVVSFIVAGYETPLPIQSRTKEVERGLEGYRQLKLLRDPIRVSHYIALTIVALLSMFVSTWIGFHLARGITGPIMDLAEGTERIAKGDYEVIIESPAGGGEVRTLVESFNRMTRDLKVGRSQLTEKNIELQNINLELEQRRRYMEIVLQNVAAGVISVDAEGLITTINNSAEDILHISATTSLGRPFAKFMAPELEAIVGGLMRSAEKSRKGSAERQVKVRVGDHVASLHIHLSRLMDDQGEYLGMVLVFDDLTELEKVQRMSAWREVARRIAHEIKNPLTPIQLSTQRLRKRYGERLADDNQLFDECTQMIIRQVDELKRLVSEFSNFARLPEADPSPNDLAGIVEETLVLYQDDERSIEFLMDPEAAPPVFNLDREQIKRVLINLLDNAVAATGPEGRIEIRLAYERQFRMARLEVADDGAGIPPADKLRLFEPYFSTKKSGTGLGLAIVRTIVADHDGFVRVQDNHPKGTRVVIELPVKT